MNRQAAAYGLGGFILGAVLALVYEIFVRPILETWGATRQEMWGALPGDDLLSDEAVDQQMTRGVTIDAPREYVWDVLMGADGLLAERVRHGSVIVELEPGSYAVLEREGMRYLGTYGRFVHVHYLESLPEGRTRYLVRSRIRWYGPFQAISLTLHGLLDFIFVIRHMQAVRVLSESRVDRLPVRSGSLEEI